MPDFLHNTPLSRRHFLLGSSLAVGAAGLGLAPQLFAASNNLADLNLSVATYKGGDSYFFDDAHIAKPPYRVDYAEFPGGNLIVEALASGSLDIGGMSEIPPIFSVQSQRQPRLIAVVKGDVNNQVFLIPKDSTLQSVGDLRGKKVGFVRATTSHYFLIKALREQGLTLADITPIALSPQDGFTAFQSGQLDAWVIYGVFIQLAKFRSGARVLKTALGILSGNYLVAARPAALDEPLRRQAIQDYLQRESQALQWINDNPDLWAARSAQLLGIDKEVFLDQHRNWSQPYSMVEVNDAAIASQQEVADVFQQAGVLDRHIDVAPLWARDFRLQS